MDECENCGRTLASHWKFCLYCGRPMAATKPAPLPERTPVTGQFVFDDADDDLPQRARKFDGPFWLGITLGVAGLGIIIFAAAQMISANV